MYVAISPTTHLLHPQLIQKWNIIHLTHANVNREVLQLHTVYKKPYFLLQVIITIVQGKKNHLFVAVALLLVLHALNSKTATNW